MSIPDETVEPTYRRMLDADRPNWPSDQLFQHYRRHYLSEVDRGRFILDTIRHYVPAFEPEGARVLDIGCGDAGVPIAFASAGAVASGLEPGFPNLVRGRARADDHQVQVGVVRGVAETLPFPAAALDLVILDNVLEHVGDRERTLTEIHRVLAPDGLLYMVTPKPFAALSLVSDPHYGTSGLVLLPRSWQERVIERTVGPGAYDVGRIPTRRWLMRALRRHGFRSLVPPRELWIRYLQHRISRPEDVRPGLKRWLARWLTEHPGVFDVGVVRWLLDVALGSNFILARRQP